MWMVGGYNESSHHHHHNQLSLVPHDAFNGRRLRPLIPRPPDVSSTPFASSATTPSCNLSRCSVSDLFSLNHHLGVGGEQGCFKKEMSNGGQPVMVSTSRWNPTPEQLRILEDLYQRGTRTPSTEQIQHITAELRRYGKIEGKNVFYWFQNHKARERQKRRRELELLPHDHQPIIERKERGGVSGKTGFEAEQSRSIHSISSAVAEESVEMSMQRAATTAAKAGKRAEQGRRREWLFNLDDEREFQKHHSLSSTSAQRNATWQHLKPFCHATSPPLLPTITCISPTVSNKEGRRDEEGYDDVEGGQNDDVSATLQLFPLRSQQVEREHEREDEKERDIHFFEFLPTKN